MNLFDQITRRRRVLRVGLLVVGCAVGLSVAAFERWRQPEAYRLWGCAYEVMSSYLGPVEARIQATVRALSRAGRLWEVENENRRLRGQLSRLRTEQQLSKERLRRIERLSGLGRWSGPPQLAFLPTDVIGVDKLEQNALLEINRGRADGVQSCDPVVALDGLVGIVREVASPRARVQALTDPMSAVGAVVRDSRVRGVVYGRGHDRPLEFMPDSEIQPIEKGGVLVTSGFSQSVFPKGIVIGTIEGRQLNARGISYGSVAPAVRFDMVEEVLVVIPVDRTAEEDAPTSPTLGRFSIRMPGHASDAPTTPTMPLDASTTATTSTDLPTTATTSTDVPTSGPQSLATEGAP